MRDDNCISRGKCWKKNCSACPEGPTLQEEIVLTAELQKGMRDRDTIIFEEVNWLSHYVYIVGFCRAVSGTTRDFQCLSERDTPYLGGDKWSTRRVLMF